jgi:hypothetical protein
MPSKHLGLFERAKMLAMNMIKLHEARAFRGIAPQRTFLTPEPRFLQINSEPIDLANR